MFNNGELELLIRDVKNMWGMTTPMNRILIDTYINYVLNVLLDQLIVVLRLCIKNILKRTVNLKSFISLQKKSFI